jgi:hypothetical protein
VLVKRWSPWWLSSSALVAANAVPLGGVLYGGWRVFNVLLLYSLENIVIGAYNVLKMRRAPCDEEELRRTWDGVSTKRGLIRFFCVHYGGFVVVHLFFVVMLFGVVFADRGTGRRQSMKWRSVDKIPPRVQGQPGGACPALPSARAIIMKTAKRRPRRMASPAPA